MELKKIGILSLAKIAGLFGVIYGFISGIFSMMFTRVLLAKFPEIAQQFGVVQATGIGQAILMIFVFGIIYFIIGIILAFAYNLLAKYVGGIKLEFAEKKK